MEESILKISITSQLQLILMIIWPTRMPGFCAVAGPQRTVSGYQNWHKWAAIMITIFDGIIKKSLNPNLIIIIIIAAF